MSESFARAFRRSIIGGAALAGLLPGLAMAQGAPAEEEAAAHDEIVVTGTFVRGIAPPGASPISVNSKTIEEIGATNVNQVLQTIPQLSGSFGKLQQPLAANASVAVNRPSLRDLGSNTSGGSSTLVLMNGHRLVGMGISSTTPDPDIIPPGVLERVEVVPDGGSAVYGSDAVAGVLNFITIKRFDGVKVDASYGFADDYYQWDANVTAGKDWGSGSLFASYSYAKTDQILGRDRDYVREYRDSLGFTTLACGAGNVQNAGATSSVFGLPFNGGLTPPNQNCDASDFATVFPASKRHSVFAGLTQQLDDTLTFELTGYYTNRQTDIQLGPNRASVLVASNPAFVPTSVASPFKPAGTPFASNVYFQWGPDNAQRSHITLETWGVTPTFTKTLGSSFRLRLMGNYGESKTTFTSTGINGTALRSAISSGLIDPFNLNNPATPGVAGILAQVNNFGSFNQGRQSMLNARAIVDGDLLNLPGGAVKIAVGLEYSKETLRAQSGNAVPGFEDSGFAGSGIIAPQAPLPRFDLSRHSKSAFGEIVVPIFGADNAIGGFQQLTVSVAGRYDDYSDFGDTFNPRFGVTWKPVDWVSIHGAWGKSFNAPSLADDENASPVTFTTLTGSAASAFKPPAGLQGGNPYPNYPATNNAIYAIQGNKPGIKPQTATTWSLGIDLTPPFVPGLTFGVNYYNINFRDFISLAPFESAERLYTDFGSVITTSDGTPASVAALQAVLNNAFASATVCRDASSTIACAAPVASTAYAFFDARKQNLGDLKTSGLDFSLNYRTDTGFGSLFLNSYATYVLGYSFRAPGAAAYADQASTGRSRFRSRTTIGADIGNLTASATWTHLQGYTLTQPVGYNNPGAGFVQQTRLGSFNTIDLFFRYDLKGEGFTKDLAFTLNVNNLFDQDPPLYIGSNQVAGRLGYDNGATLGRLFQFGVSKKF